MRDRDESGDRVLPSLIEERVSRDTWTVLLQACFTLAMPFPKAQGRGRSWAAHSASHPRRQSPLALLLPISGLQALPLGPLNAAHPEYVTFPLVSVQCLLDTGRTGISSLLLGHFLLYGLM